ncbi:MAG TPA: PQQ-dependent sugar dehydrogenase [Polyangiaceae bacterium]
MQRLCGLLLALTTGCYATYSSSGGGEVEPSGARPLRQADIAVPDGYVIEPVMQGLTFPTAVTFDEQNRLCVLEAGYAYGEVWTTPRLLRLHPGQGYELLASGTNGPWTGVAFHKGNFYVSEGGQRYGGRILRVTPQRQIEVVAEGLPGLGDHHTNGPVVGPDGWLYFGQGTATNSGVVGTDNADFGWLRRHPEVHDVPCRDVTLTGKNFETKNPFDSEHRRVKTGAYVPYGTRTNAGQVIKGRLPCTGAILRVRPEGGPLELVAWGLRNPFGLAFDAQGRLYATDNGADDRGSRPVFGAADSLFLIEPGAWYGWPDHSEGRRLDHDRYEPPGGPKLERLLQHHPTTPPQPVAYFPVHASANGFDFSKNAGFGYVGEAFVGVFGDQAPQVGKVMAPVGFKVIRVNVQTGVSYDFAVNRGDESGPASLLRSGGLERPVSARFDPFGSALYVVDFGVMAAGDKGPVPVQQTGVVWRIRPRGAGP